MNNLFKGFGKFIFSCMVLLLAIFALLAVGLKNPKFQTLVVQKVAFYLTQKLGQEVTVGSVSLRWFDTLVLEDVNIKDHHQNPMVAIKKVKVDFKLASINDTNKISIDHIYLQKPVVNLVQYKTESKLNINDLIDRAVGLLASKEPKKPSKSIPFIIEEASVENGTFSLDYKADPYLRQPDVFEYSHFRLDNIYGQVMELRVDKGVLAIEVEDLRCEDKAAKVKVKELNTLFSFGDHEMKFDKLYAHINDSKIRNFLTFKYQSMDDFIDFNRKVLMEARLDESVVTTADLAHFAQPMNQFKDTYFLDGQFKGKVIDFSFKKSKISFGKNSKLLGDFAFKGLPDVAKMLMDFQMQNTTINARDLEQYVGKKVASPIEKFGTVALSGTFKGLYNDFVTKVNYKTALGDAFADLEMKITPNLDNSTYEGKLDLVDFDLGKLINNKELLQKIAISGKIVGQGFDVNKAVLRVDADIENVGVQGYNYNNIYVNGKLQKGLFDGHVSIRDTNLACVLDGKVDFRNSLNRFDIEGELTNLNLKPLHLSDSDMNLVSKMSLHFDGIELDKIKGTGKFKNTYLTLPNRRNLLIDSMYVYSFISPKDSSRSLGLISNVADAYATGKFSLSQAIRNLSEVISEYQLYFFDNEENRRAYYTSKMFTPIQAYSIDYNCQIKNGKPIMAFFYPEGYVSPRAKIEGTFKVGNTTRLDLLATVDTLKTESYQFFGSNIEINTSKFANSPEVLASSFIESQSQKIKSLSPTENLHLEAVWDKDRIAFNGNLDQIKSTNRAELDGALKFVPTGIEVQFGKSKFHLLDGDWVFSPKNLIQISGNEIKVNDVFLKNGLQQIGAVGYVSADSSKVLTLQTDNFNLQTLAPLLQTDLKGTVTGKAELRNLYGNTGLDGSVSVRSLAYDNFLIGNLLSEGKWDKEKQQINIDANIERLGTKTLTLEGRYSPQKTKDALSLRANLTQTNLKILEPFTKGLFSQIDGTATGLIKIEGTPTKPILDGEIVIKKGKVKFDYLNTIWSFEDKIFFEESEIGTKKLSVTDDDGNTAIVSGGVFHDGFSSILLDFKANMKNFKVLNTVQKENQMYYGTAYVTGKLEIAGGLEKLAIKANVKTNKNTKLFIPLNGGAGSDGEDYVEFVDFSKTKNDSLDILTAKNQDKSAGIAMDFDLDVTPEASCEIQFDSQSGDIIKANGSGKLAIHANTNGDFAMTGQYVIDKGDYTFTFQNILNKKFSIRSGSSITWNGDPFGALLDMKAVYTQNTSLYPILDTTQTRNEAQYKRRYPVNVVLSLSDKLTAPRIGYDVEIKDYPQLPAFNSGVTAFMSKIKDDEQELSRQVSGVIALGQLLPQDPLRAFGNDNLLNNLSELISNQVSMWVSQIDKNLQVDLSAPIQNLNQNLMNSLQLKFSYTFLEDRLRITRNGGFTNSQNQTDNLSLIGDWSLEWLITRDGKLKLKGYNRNIQNPFASLNNSSVTTTTGGASLLYTQSFNHLFGKKKRTTSEVTGLKTDLMP